MKQCCYIILAIAMCLATASAQDEDVLRPHGRPDGDKSRDDTSPKQSTRFIIGPEIGMNLNMFSSTVTGGTPQSEIGVLKTGSGISAFFGAYFEVGINRQFGIGARLLYDMKSVSNTMDSAVRECASPGTTVEGFIPLMPFRMEFDQRVTYITINPLLRWSPAEELIIHLGPVIQLAASDFERDIRRTIAEDEACRFLDSAGLPTRFSNSSDVDSAATATRFGLDIGIGYRIAIAPSIALVPRIGYQFMFSPIGPDVAGFDQSQPTTGTPSFTQTDRKLSSLQASIALWFTL